jgi:hypothetical protein
LVVNPATGNFAQKSVIAQQARDAKKLKTRMAEEERVEAAKKSKFDSLVTLDGLTSLGCVRFGNEVEWNVMVPFQRNGMVPFLCSVGTKK